MTTDPAAAPRRSGAPDAAAARLDALRQRRATAPARDRTSHPAAQRRRRHAAIGARILAGGLSVSLTMGLVAAMASADDNSNTATNTMAPAPAVAVVDHSPQTASEVVQRAPAPNVHPTDAAPVTSSQGS